MSNFFTNFLYDHFDWGDNPYRTVHCRITTEFGKVVQRKLPAEAGYVIDEKSKNAWLLDHSGEVPLRGEKYTELILDERDAYPWMPGKVSKGKREEWGRTIDKISANEFARQKNQAEAQIIKDKKNSVILMIFTLAAICLVLMILAMFAYTYFIA